MCLRAEQIGVIGRLLFPVAVIAEGRILMAERAALRTRAATVEEGLAMAQLPHAIVRRWLRVRVTLVAVLLVLVAERAAIQRDTTTAGNGIRMSDAPVHRMRGGRLGLVALIAPGSTLVTQ